LALDMMDLAAHPYSDTDMRSFLEPHFCRVFSSDLDLAYRHVDRLCLQLCFHVANECALLEATAQPLTEIVSRVGVVEEAIYLARAILDVLCEEGYAKYTAEGFSQIRPYPSDDCDKMQQEARTACPAAQPIFALIERCHRGAIDFLTGRRKGVSVVFERGDTVVWERVYSSDRVMSVYADLVPPTLEAIGQPRMRFLEVGGGVGAVLRRALPLLEKLGFETYTFTDIGQSFVQAAKRHFEGVERLSFARIDLDLPLHSQHVPPTRYDVVIAVNVLHVLRSLSFSLRELHGVLKPLGWLLIAEGSPPSRTRRWRLDVVFGFLRGWSNVSVEPPWRLSTGFLLPTQWKGALESVGYDPVHVLPGERWFRGPCRGGLVLARKPER
jgi:SAM-dependent methyltransferase